MHNRSTHPGAAPYSAVLVVALRLAGLRDLSDLADVVGCKPQTLRAIRHGSRRLTATMRRRIGRALRVRDDHVEAIFLIRVEKRAA